MNAHLFVVPYDSALRSVRMGAGPERLLSAGLVEGLRSAGHDVRADPVVVRHLVERAHTIHGFARPRHIASRTFETSSRSRSCCWF